MSIFNAKMHERLGRLSPSDNGCIAVAAVYSIKAITRSNTLHQYSTKQKSKNMGHSIDEKRETPCERIN